MYNENNVPNSDVQNTSPVKVNNIDKIITICK